MKEKERQAIASRLSTATEFGHELRADLERLKTAERYEIVAEVGSMSFIGQRGDQDGRGFVQSFPAFLRDECFKGLKPKIAGERVASLILAARKVAGSQGEAALLSELIKMAASVSVEAKATYFIPEYVVAASRHTRPSMAAICTALNLRVMGFEELVLWGRIAAISASADPIPAEAESLAAAIKRLFELRGMASNVVPSELRTLQKSLGVKGVHASAPTESKCQELTQGVEQIEASTPPAAKVESNDGQQQKAVVPTAPPPALPSMDVLQILEAAIAAIGSERKAARDAEKSRANLIGDLQEKLRIAESSLGDEKALRRKQDEKIANLSSDISSSQMEIERLRREGGITQEELARASTEIAALVEKKRQLEVINEASKAAALKIIQKAFRDEAATPLKELGDYIRMAVAGQEFEIGRLGRSFDRFSKIVQRLMLPDSEGTRAGQ